MTDTAAHPSLLERAREWLRHEAHAHNAKSFIPDLVAELHKLWAEIETLKAEVAALKAKDGPLVEQVAHDAAPVVAEVVKDAAGVVADVQTAAGA